MFLVQIFLRNLRKRKKIARYARNFKKVIRASRRGLSLFFGYNSLGAQSTFCKGRGLEIGPSTTPYPFGLNVELADFQNDERTSGFDLPQVIPLIPPKCLLTSVKDGNYDFVYAAHVLEHSFNPLKSLEEWTRVTTNQGTIYIVVPNKSKTYDRFRKNTSIGHLVRKYEKDSWDFSEEEVENMIKDTLPADDCPFWYKSDNESLSEIVHKIYKHPDGSDHYSVFDTKSFLSFIDVAEKICNLELIYFQISGIEFHAVFKKVK